MDHGEGVSAGGAVQSGATADRERRTASRRRSDQIDFHIDSTPIDLGLVQGFTTALTNVTGTLAGARRRHRLGGRSRTRRRRDASRRRRSRSSRPASATRTSQGTIELQPDRVHIDADHGARQPPEPLSITGDLAVHERAGRRRPALRHRERLQGDRQRDGQRPGQQQPGDRRASCGRRASRAILASSTGRVNLDPIIALVGDSAYATEETEYLTRPTPAPDAPQPAPPHLRRADDGRAPDRAERPGRQGQRAADARVRDQPRRAERDARRRPARHEGAGAADRAWSAPSTPCAAPTTSRAGASRSCATARSGSTRR